MTTVRGGAGKGRRAGAALGRPAQYPAEEPPPVPAPAVRAALRGARGRGRSTAGLPRALVGLPPAPPPLLRRAGAPGALAACLLPFLLPGSLLP